MTQRLRKKYRKQVGATDKPYLCKVIDLPKKEDHPGWNGSYPFKDGDTVLMLGEIEQMPGHVAIALKDGRVLFGYHAEYFRKLSQEEA
jgi:hypothetical protein